MKMLDELIRICNLASERILSIYKTDFPSEVKTDESPVTPADHASHETIVEELTLLDPGIPILSEECEIPAYESRAQWSTYWLIDPLDGTKGFIDKSGQFTVNIALVDSGDAILGAVAIPISAKVYCGDARSGVAFIRHKGVTQGINTRKVSGKVLQVLQSRHHPSTQNDFLNRHLEKLGYELRCVKRGSSLKFCTIAEGEADLFLRAGPTSEWDTAAPQAVLTAAGGQVCTLNGESRKYNQSECLINPSLVSFGDPDIPWVEYVRDALVD